MGQVSADLLPKVFPFTTANDLFLCRAGFFRGSDEEPAWEGLQPRKEHVRPFLPALRYEHLSG